MSSPSDRVYSLEQLLQFDSRSSSSAASSSPSRLSTGPNNSVFSAAALSQMRSLFPDIVPDEEDQGVTSTDADPASRSSDHVNNNNNMDVDSEYDEEYDEDDGFVYGDVVIRGDLHEDIVDRLRQAVHEALSPRAFLASTPATTTIKSTTGSMNNRVSKPLSYRSNKPSDLPWRSSHPNNATATMGSTNTRGRAVYNHGHYSPPHSASSTSSGSSSYSYHDRRNFGVNLFKQANALHNNNYNPQFAKKTGADSDNWRARESTVTSWRNTNVKWNESTSSYVPVAV